MDFLGNLTFEQSTPLLSIAEVENMGASFSNKEEKEKPEEKQTTEVKEDNPGGLLPITELVENKELEKKEKPKEEKLSTSDYLDIIKGIQERTGELGDFNIEDFKGGKEELIEVIENLVYSTAENKANDYIKTNLPEDYQKFVELTDAGVSEEDAATVVNGLKSIAGLTADKLDDEKVAKTTYMNYLRLTSSWNEAKIKKEVERLEELGTLVDEAKETLPELIEIINGREAYVKAEAKKKEEAEKQNQLKRDKELKDYLETTEEIAGIKLNKKMKDAWMKQYQPVKTSTGDITTPLALKQSYNPQEFGALVNFYDSIGLFKYDQRSKKYTPDFSVLKSLGTKEAIKQLEEAVNTEKLKAQTKGGMNPDNEDILDKEEIQKRMLEIQNAWKQKSNSNSY